MERQTVNLSTGPLTYGVVGEGRPVLFLHPAGGLRWSPFHEGLARSFKVYAPTMPGFDGTPFHESVTTMDGHAKIAGEFIDQVIGENCDVIGHSFGGWLATWLAVLRPDRVEHLVLEAPAGFRPKGSPGLPREPAALTAALFVHPEKAPPAADPARMLANHQALPHYGGGRRDTDDALVARLHEIEAVTLILRGTADPLIPDESVQLLRSRIKRAYLIYIWDASHAVEIDQPERMLRVVESFLKRSDAFIVNWESAAVG
jgi:pimeloyl-ACP methyl ester carboxylesterase